MYKLGIYAKTNRYTSNINTQYLNDKSGFCKAKHVVGIAYLFTE